MCPENLNSPPRSKYVPPPLLPLCVTYIGECSSTCPYLRMYNSLRVCSYNPVYNCDASDG